jgi:dTDP-4-amino-4,6-dideoxygalactose transaminase
MVPPVELQSGREERTVEPVPLLDLKPQYAALRAEIDRALHEVVEAQSFILGRTVERFEEQLGRYVGSAHAVGCASGTDALILALAALGVGPGDEVVTSPFSFFSSASCAYKVGARPAFADIDERTFNLDPAAAEAAIGPRTRVLLPVHLFGQCAAMDALLELARRHRLAVVEDACQALGTTYARGGVALHAGTMGEIGCYSFFPSKNLGGFGDGGLVATSDGDLAERLRLLRVHGGRQMYHHRYVGWNSRLDAIQAAVLGVKLPHLDAWSRARAERAARYDRWFRECGLVEAGHVRLPEREAGSTHIYNQYTIRAERRDELRRHLEACGVGHAVYYPVPLHLQECFRELGYREGSLPRAERAAREVLSLPVYPDLDIARQERVVAAVAEFYGLRTGSPARRRP